MVDSYKETSLGDIPSHDVHNVEEHGDGRVSLALGMDSNGLAALRNKFSSLNPIIDRKLRERAAVVRRDSLDRSSLDLYEKVPSEDDPHSLFKRSIKYYYDEDIYGPVIRLLTNFSASGFDNDIDDDVNKDFFDSWCFDTNMESIVEQIFFDLFRVGMVRTYKIMGEYVPDISIYNPLDITKYKGLRKEKAAKKKVWSKFYVPLRYTVINPLSIEISGSSMFGTPVTSIKGEALSDIKALLDRQSSGEKLSAAEKEVLARLDVGLKKAAMKGEAYVLDAARLGAVDYRKMPYERYPRPRGVNAFESIDYKSELRKADYSTLDGITNYILLITVGSDEFPVTKPEVLANVADLFNTTSKSFDIVWNHTLKIQKIVSPEIESILGQAKYEQVNEDYTGALGVVRALIDGSGSITAGAAELAIKSVIAEVAYARRQVKTWLYNEYKQVARAMGFDRIPVVRFNDVELRDEVQLMKAIMGLIDRRIISYETGIKKLSYDSKTEMKRLTTEKDRVAAGDFGILGSPYNQRAEVSPSNVQDEQRTPKGTPSEGRPVGTGAPKEEENSSFSGDARNILEDSRQLSLAEREYLLELIKADL